MLDDFPFPGEDNALDRFQHALEPKPEEHCKENYRHTSKGVKKIIEKRKVDYANIEREVKTASCCSKKCINSVLTVSHIYKTREYFLKKSREEQGHFLLDFFQLNRRRKGQRTVYAYFVGEIEVCQKAWIFSHGMSYGRYVTLKLILCYIIV